ncbi:MAG: cation diffusion facilitator family transporter [Symbiobacteriia bacterium]
MSKERLTTAAVILSVVLFGLKLWAGHISGSIAVVSDALNSFLDIGSYSIIALSTRIQDLSPDYNHPFGHRRAEPLAGFLIAIFAGLLGATIVKDAIFDVFTPGQVTYTPVTTIVLMVSIAAKAVLVFLYLAQYRQHRGPALKASLMDSRNDILASGLALSGFWLGGMWDKAAAFLIGAWIFYSGLRIGLENMGYLMGRAPDKGTIELIRTAASRVPGVRTCHTVRGHYVGDQIQVEVQVEVPSELTLAAAHDLGVAVKCEVESLPEVLHAFVHIDPEGLEEDRVREEYRPWRQKGTSGGSPRHAGD